MAELDGKTDHDTGSLAHESCQTALSMSEMQVVSSLAQVVHCERHAHQLRSGGSPRVYEHTCGSERGTPNSVTWASSSPGAGTQLYSNIPSVTKIIPRLGSQPSPPKGSKLKWNSDVRCNWPPTSPPRGGPGSASTKKLAGAPDSKTRDVAVMTFPTIKKVEALELKLDVHVGSERQLLSVNEQLRKRYVIVVGLEIAAFQ